MSAKEKAQNNNFRITRVYTKTGDEGMTGLVGGKRVAKNDTRIEAYGTVDELSSFIGQARVFLSSETSLFDNPAHAELLNWHLEYIQHQLFVLGGDLATPLSDRHPMMPIISIEHVEYMEQVCDHFNDQLPPLKDFILPGGSQTASSLHIARTICRRAERAVITAAKHEEDDINDTTLVYLNRLSDALFVLSRWVNYQMKQAEFIWKRKLAVPPFPTKKS